MKFNIGWHLRLAGALSMIVGFLLPNFTIQIIGFFVHYAGISLALDRLEKIERGKHE